MREGEKSCKRLLRKSSKNNENVIGVLKPKIYIQNLTLFDMNLPLENSVA